MHWFVGTTEFREKNEEKHLEEITNELTRKLIPYGYSDLQKTAQALDESDVSFNDFTEYTYQFSEECEIAFKDIDVCGLAYEYILQEARLEIEQAIGVDIINDLNDEVHVCANYCGTTYDYENDAIETRQTIQSILGDQRSKLLNWFFDEIGGEENDVIDLEKEITGCIKLEDDKDDVIDIEAALNECEALAKKKPLSSGSSE